jgi:two-component system, cell cycle response regulator
MRTVFRRRDRATWYAVAGAFLSLGEPIGLLIVRELSGTRPLLAELSQELATYAYVFVTMAVVLSILGYLVGRQADQLAALSETDALTRLPNRRALRHRLLDELRRAERYRMPMSLVFADVDGLKRINDQHGHAAGDQAIQRVAAAITATLRASDLGARWGGDEFAMVLPNTGADAACHSAERLFAHLAGADDAKSNQVTVSIGIATFDPARSRSISVEQLEQSADQALYAAKQGGRNRIVAA